MTKRTYDRKSYREWLDKKNDKTLKVHSYEKNQNLANKRIQHQLRRELKEYEDLDNL